MKEPIDYLSTLFVGIDIASRIHVVSALDFNEKFYIKMKPVENTQEGAALIEQMISDVLEHNHQFRFVVIGMEATGFYGVHLANYLSASDRYETGSGKTETIVSDADWKYAESPIRRNNVYLGEHYDARKEKQGWNTSAYQEKPEEWKNAVLVARILFRLWR